jgi:hypothetical protein
LRNIKTKVEGKNTVSKHLKKCMQTNKECKVKNKKGTNEQKQKNVEKKNKHHGIKYNIGQNQIDWHWRKNGKV